MHVTGISGTTSDAYTLGVNHAITHAAMDNFVIGRRREPTRTRRPKRRRLLADFQAVQDPHHVRPQIFGRVLVASQLV